MLSTDDIPASSGAAVLLFSCLSRFEFALKEAGYVIGEEGKKASADWAAFEATLEGTDAFKALSEAPDVRILFEHPPRRQIKIGQSWEWSDPGEVTNIQQFSAAVRQVRNILFHGGKSGANPRDEALCKASVFALLLMLEFAEPLKPHFQGIY